MSSKKCNYEGIGLSIPEETRKLSKLYLADHDRKLK